MYEKDTQFTQYLAHRTQTSVTENLKFRKIKTPPGILESQIS